MKDICLIIPGEISKHMKIMAKTATEGLDVEVIKDIEDISSLNNKKIIFAVQLDSAGYNIPLFKILSKLREMGRDAMKGSSAVIIVNSPSELYTKSLCHNIIFLANQMGCRFPGHPIVEVTSNFKNLSTWKKKLDMPLEDISLYLCRKLRENFLKENPQLISNPRILVLHASSYKTSNTLMLWEMIRRNLKNCTIEIFHVENGTIVDCKGCSYRTCKHYSKNNSCFYGGAIVKEILPAIEKADAVVWICPNYNDAISAKLTAVINRMTVLYKKIKFYNKTIFGIVVSGNSGADSVAKQLIGALNINKGFRLPPYFAIMEIANDPKEIKYVEDIEIKAKEFAHNMMKEIKA